MSPLSPGACYISYGSTAAKTLQDNLRRLYQKRKILQYVRQQQRIAKYNKILRAEERKLSQIEVASMLRELTKSLEAGDAKALRALVQARVDGYHSPQDVAL